MYNMRILFRGAGCLCYNEHSLEKGVGRYGTTYEDAYRTHSYIHHVFGQHPHHLCQKQIKGNISFWCLCYSRIFSYHFFYFHRHGCLHILVKQRVNIDEVQTNHHTCS